MEFGHFIMEFGHFMMEFGHFMMEFGHFRTDFIPIDPVGVKVSLVLGHLPGLGRVSKPIS